MIFFCRDIRFSNFYLFIMAGFLAPNFALGFNCAVNITPKVIGFCTSLDGTISIKAAPGPGQKGNSNDYKGCPSRRPVEQCCFSKNFGVGPQILIVTKKVLFFASHILTKTLTFMGWFLQ
ncbi:hypothetical protein PPACK8108_LOCUS3543 [Phakopsora pachyrhizi]|uniref:Uncharacterized protein n=1 Tax=Phakopsora pachyrhizi TaxID=170000 RepID=A0AAV0ALH2_PHAPC|nr:hypothetical protein PPACK8108_LOCUS3543 [Phakopsora pachyrhizi]